MFEITPDDIAGLNETDLRALVGQLCEAEARTCGLSASSVTWGGDQNASDGGVDVDVALPVGTAIDGFIPRPETGFQVKNMKMPPGKIGEEMRPAGAIRPAIQELADHGGAYIIVSSESTSRSMLRERLRAMKEAVNDVANAGALKLDFYDRNRLASWVRDHKGLVPWIRQEIGKAIPGWRPYSAWAYPAEGVEGEYLLDAGLRLLTGKKEDGQGLDAKQGLQHMRALLSKPSNVARLVGLSGVGKTRFLQALFDSRVGEQALDPSLAIYTNVADEPDPAPTALVTNLIAEGKRQILVIDNCTPELHRRLSEICRSQGSNLSLVTVEHDVRDDQPEGTEVFRLEPSTVDLIEKLTKHRFPELSVVNARTIAEHSGGNARMAIAIAGTVGKNETISGLNDDELFRRLFQQGHGEDDSLLQAAQALSLVYSFHGEDVSDQKDAELVRLGALVGKGAQEMFRHAAELYRRDLVQSRGVYRAVLPQALANHLAKRALQNIPPSVIEAQLINGAAARLLRSLSRRLGYLSDSREAATIVNGWLAPDGLLGEAAADSNELVKAMFENVAPVAPEAALTAIERVLLGRDADEALPRRTHFVRPLRQLAYDAVRFDRCVALIAKFAAADVKEARDIFPSLFYLYLSGTHATLSQRQEFLRRLLDSDHPCRRSLGVEGLKATLERWHFNSSNSFEFGARSRDPGYWPANGGEARVWFRSALKFAGEVAVSASSAAAEVRAAIADQLRGLWTVAGLFDEVEQICRAIATRHFWREGWIAIREIQHYDSKAFAPEVSARLFSLERLLRPVDLLQQVHAIVLSRRYHDLIDFDGPGNIHERIARANATVHSLGKQVALDEGTFGELVGELLVCAESNEHLWIFGQGLAEGSVDPEARWNRLRLQLAATPEEKRNVVVLRGFLQGLQVRNPELANDLLDNAVHDEVLGPYYPLLEAAVKIDKRGVGRLMRAIDLGKTHPSYYQFLAHGRATDPISSHDLKTLVLKVATKEGGFDAAIEILYMRLYSEKDWNGGISLEMIGVGRQLMRQVVLDAQNQSEDHKLGEIAKVCFTGPAGAAPVLEICRKLKDAVAKHDTHPYYHDDLLVSLFTVQPRACLDGLCAGDGAELQRGMRIIDDIRQSKASLLELVPADVLLAWCDEEPASRYPAVAGCISISTEAENGPPRDWTKFALRLLEKAPDRVAVLKKFVGEFRGQGGWGSPVAIFEANAKLLDKLEGHPDPSVSAFVAQERAWLARQIEIEQQLENSADRVASQSFE